MQTTLVPENKSITDLLFLLNTIGNDMNNIIPKIKAIVGSSKNVESGKTKLLLQIIIPISKNENIYADFKTLLTFDNLFPLFFIV